MLWRWKHNLRSFMEIKHILNEHQPTALRNGREEPIEYASSHERLEGGGACTPYRSEEGEHQIPEKNWQATEVRRQSHDNDSPCSDHKDIANL